jgi:hypothetical protein
VRQVSDLRAANGPSDETLIAELEHESDWFRIDDRGVDASSGSE